MRKLPMVGLRVAGLMAMALFIAHCGDSDVHINAGGVDPTPGTFVGATDEGGAIEIDVGSIERIEFDCDGALISHNFSPPARVRGGTFDVDFRDEGRDFHVRGRFLTNDTVEGSINDEDDQCDVSFEAVRQGSTGGTPRTRTPTPNITPPPGGTTAPGGDTPTETSTPGPGETATPTPGTSGSVTATATGPTPCPNKVTLEGQGEQGDLDTGWNGIGFDQKVVGKGTLTVGLSCPGTPGSCGDCTVSGPIASTTILNSVRMISDPSMTCTPPAAGSPPPSGCAFFFGAPLPLSAGSIPACVLNRVNGSVTGTANPDTGTGTSVLTLVSSVFNGITAEQPCPTCSGASFGATGTCNGGPKNGAACTVHGTSALFGNTSLDCPPNAAANSGDLDITLHPTTGVSTLMPTNTCISAPDIGKPCFCEGQNKVNDCSTGTCVAAAQQEGVCQGGPSESYCVIATYRGCLQNSDCNTKPGDSCGPAKTRKCFGVTTNGNPGNVMRTGTASKTAPTLVSTFCVPATRSTGINGAVGLPGPAALRLPSKTCYANSCTF